MTLLLQCKLYTPKLYRFYFCLAPRAGNLWAPVSLVVDVRILEIRNKLERSSRMNVGQVQKGARSNRSLVSATRTPTCSAPSQDSSPYTYSSSTHRFPDESTPIEATPLSATSAELVLGVGLGLGLGSHYSSHAPLLLATLLSHNIPLPRVH